MRLTLPCLALLVGTPLAPLAGLELGLPVDCEVGTDCWPVVYFDREPSTGAADYRCGRLVYDGHTGTDFAVADLAAVARGVKVIAVAPGVVRNVRDGMSDVDVTAIGRDRLAGRDCGNGVAVLHGDGWETLYCHLRQGSIAVAPGEQVAVGQTLGMVGMSGNASFPHLELTVLRDGARLDPFTGSAEPATTASCGPGPGSLWRPDAAAALAYTPVVVTKIGFTAEPPSWQDVKQGEVGAQALPARSKALIVHFEGYALAAGDRIEVGLHDPNGRLVHTHRFEEARAQARFFRFTGKRAPADGLAPGNYRATLRWTDATGQLLWTGEAELRVE